MQTRCFFLSDQKFRYPRRQFVAADDADFLAIDEGVEDRTDGFQLLDIQHDFIPDCVVEHVARSHGIFETCDDFIAGEIARDAANETSSRAVSKQYSGAIREVAQTTDGARPVLHS